MQVMAVALFCVVIDAVAGDVEGGYIHRPLHRWLQAGRLEHDPIGKIVVVPAGQGQQALEYIRHTTEPRN